jgi:hypothetical protein
VPVLKGLQWEEIQSFAILLWAVFTVINMIRSLNMEIKKHFLNKYECYISDPCLLLFTEEVLNAVRCTYVITCQDKYIQAF